MGLHAEDKTIYELLNDKSFIIPENQRQYVWDNNNWTELFDDINLVYTQKIKNHFIGSVVLKDCKITDGIKKHYIIIDGQQRISTLTIIFCVIAFLYAENHLIDSFNGVKKYLMVTDNKGKYHAILSNSANPGISKIVDFLYGDFYAQLSSGFPLLDCKTYLENLKISKNIKECFMFFYNSFNCIINGNVSNIDILRDVIIQINYIDIIALEDEDAYTIFEILNARGKPLNDFELLRNFLLKYAASENKEKVKNELTKLETLLGDHVDIFLKHYVTHRYGRKADTKENRPYKIIVKNEKEKDKNLLMSDLNLKAKYYNKMINFFDCSDNEKKIFLFFKQRRQQQFRPIVMGLMHQRDLDKIDDKAYNEALNYLYSFFICYNIIGEQNSNKIEDIVYSYSHMIENNFTKDTISKMKKSMGERIPSENHMKNTIKNIKYSNHNKAYSGSKKADNVRVIFEVLERKKGTSIELPSANFNIEHCYSDSLDQKGEEKYMIGNFILLESDLNREECKAKPIKEKIKFYKQSVLKCPNELVNQLDINYDFDISNRTEQIATELTSYIKTLSGDY